MRHLHTVSWVLLAIAAGLTLLGSLGSASIAYVGDGSNDAFGAGGPTVRDLAAWRADVATAIRARRGTAAAYAAGYAALMLFVVLGPYRRGESWAWWAVLASMLTLVVLVLARVPTLGTRLGAGAALVQLAVVGIALLLDLARPRARPVAAAA